jgi:hypothetical protein
MAEIGHVIPIIIAADGPSQISTVLLIRSVSQNADLYVLQ